MYRVLFKKLIVNEMITDRKVFSGKRLATLRLGNIAQSTTFI